MKTKTNSRYGTWLSPITSEQVVSNSIHIEELKIDGEDIYWLESRPNESGRQVIVRFTQDGMINDVTPPDFNVRTRVHEYGGSAYQIFNGTIYFTNYLDQRIYRQVPGKIPEPLTAAGNFRYADFCMDEVRQQLVCVREEHSETGSQVDNSLVCIPLNGLDPIQVLASGNDFYSNPHLSPDGTQITWLTWNHPNMPWDGSELWLSNLDPSGNIIQSRLVAGGQNESIFQPEWSPDGVLHFVSDRTGWWNLIDGKMRRMSLYMKALQSLVCPSGCLDYRPMGSQARTRSFALIGNQGKAILPVWKLDQEPLPISKTDTQIFHRFALKLEKPSLLVVPPIAQQNWFFSIWKQGFRKYFAKQARIYLIKAISQFHYKSNLTLKMGYQLMEIFIHLRTRTEHLRSMKTRH
jgi:hypothetical protein